MLIRDAVHRRLLPGERVEPHARCAEVVLAGRALQGVFGALISAVTMPAGMAVLSPIAGWARTATGTGRSVSSARS
ncbi:hypothetical protein AB0H12_14285 [Actinosynnema sp. NPDC023794]